MKPAFEIFLGIVFGVSLGVVIGMFLNALKLYAVLL